MTDVNQQEQTDARIRRMYRSLDGLSVGDAFGECFFPLQLNPQSWHLHFQTRTVPNFMGRWTDDTAMACSVVEVLIEHGSIDCDTLASAFARRYAADDRRGYGGTAHGILRAIAEGVSWTEAAGRVMSGSGSMGNGAAMRVAPLGAYFSGDPEAIVLEATKSAQVTHAHPEGIAGGVAVALAAGYFGTDQAWDRDHFFATVLDHTPESLTRAKIIEASAIADTCDVAAATSTLGNGEKVTAPDTVPFCFWCIARCHSDFEDAMWTAASGGGDVDTNCAIIGGVLAANVRTPPPDEWVRKREPLPAFGPER